MRMNNIEEILNKYCTIDLIQVIISNSTKKEDILKVKIRPILKKEELLFQTSEYIGKKVLHNNYKKEEIVQKIQFYLDGLFKQAEIKTKSNLITILVSKKGTVTIKNKTIKDSEVTMKQNLEHNRTKQYILKEGIPVPFLVDLNVMTKEGQIVKARYDKFRQINRFLEFVEDILPSLDKERELTIIDFGCGKSYLTFAMYYYLKELKNYNINVIGLDLKEDVIRTCNALRDKYQYDKLNFLQGDIASYEGVNHVDMVVSLHACDTATDYALYKAVKWNASVILSVPCCQHELNNQMQANELKSIFQYGLIKERTAALYTDALRANLLEIMGYKTQILEFIDMEHTPKNILIRGVRSDKNKKKDYKEYENTIQFLGVNPTLYQLFQEER
ncbi:SAM-dependent methyltransferase [Anaeromicropila herbilytica]|uniref:SAM-dependent methyltransferase n=2 Tax=Anaeromicropila herbilytica TaxID=2785025 RepID=A0A7R7IF49_9FIRM|nr:SAM-dependent methyltransferase [Anaeromicropila herbilytica]